MKRIRIEVTTDASGDGSAFGESALGLLAAVQLVDGTYDDGVDVTLTSENGELSLALLTKANFNSDQIVYPRTLEALNTDGTNLSTHAMPLVAGRPKVVIASGGNVKTGAVILYILE